MKINNKDRETIGVVLTHIKYIRESLEEIKDNLKDVSKHLDRHDQDIAAIEANLNNHLQQHKRDLTLLSITVSIIAFIISMLVRFIP